MTKPKKPLKALISESIARSEQEWDMTLNGRLLLAFQRGEHHKDVDEKTHRPFASFHAWLLAAPPPGCGLSSYPGVTVARIIEGIREQYQNTPADTPAAANMAALLEDLAGGEGASRG